MGMYSVDILLAAEEVKRGQKSTLKKGSQTNY